jgi:hypothetical protein
LGVVPRGEIQFSVSDVFVIVTMALSDPSTLEDPLANPAMTETCSFRLHYNSTEDDRKTVLGFASKTRSEVAP